MLDLLLKLIDQFTKLVEVGEKNREEYLKQYVQPTYDAAEKIYTDYRSLLRKLREMLVQGRGSKPIIDFLEDRREELLPARDLLRALVARRIEEGRATRFEAGVLGIMTGAATTTERPYFSTVFYNQENASIQTRRGGHTVLDLLQRFKAHDVHDFPGDQQYLLRIVDLKMEAIEKAWQNVVRGYADLQASALPKVKVPRSRRLNRDFS